MEYTDPNPQNQTYWQQPEHCVPNAPQTQLPLQHHQSQQPSFSHQPNKPSKLNRTATTENDDIDIDCSNYEHETNDAAREKLEATNQARQEKTQMKNPQSHQQKYKTGTTR
jgi:hypothetical protein